MNSENALLIEEWAQCGDWQKHMPCAKELLEKIDIFVAERENHNAVYPLRGVRLNAFKRTSLENVKVVILAQDPYINEEDGVPQATGLALSVPPQYKLPPSLKNIYKEIINSGLNVPMDGSLEGWAEQGVLLLNVTLTVDAGDSNSHKKSQWKVFTQMAIEALKERNTGLVFLSFGKDSHKVSADFEGTKHRVLRLSHPSPLGARKVSQRGEFETFMGSDCFNRTNTLLMKMGKNPIDWSR